MNFVKKYKNIIFSFGALLWLFGAVFLLPQHAFSQAPDTCRVTSASFDKTTESQFPGGNYFENSRPIITATVTTIDCSGKDLFLSIRESSRDATEINNIKFTVPATETFSIKMRAGETACNSVPGFNDCNYQIIISKNTAWTGGVFESSGSQGGNLRYDCDGICTDDWSIISTTPASTSQQNPAEECVITDAVFRSNLDANVIKDLRIVEDPNLEVRVSYEGCSGWTGQIKLTNEAPLTSNDILPVFNFSFNTPPSPLRVALHPGESECVNGADPNCKVRAEIIPKKGNVTGSVFEIVPRLEYNCRDRGFDGKGDCKSSVAWRAGTAADLGDLNTLKNAVSSETSGYVNTNGNAVTLDGEGSFINADCLDGNGQAIPGCYSIYEGLQEAIGKENITALQNANTLGDFLNAVIAWGIRLGTGLTVVMIMYNGYLYIIGRREGKPLSMEQARGRLFNNILGLLLLLTVYTILRTINPDLLNLVPNINNIAIISDQQYREATGKDPKRTSQAVDEALVAASAKGLDQCIVTTLLKKESRSNVKAIGHDENVARADIPARRAFIASGQKYSGKIFVGSVTQKSLFNDDKDIIPSAENLGLDWRFSHGIGLFQITIFPDGTQNPTRRIAGTAYSAKKLLDADYNIEAMTGLMAANMQQCGNLEDAFRMYNGGRCRAANSTTSANDYATSAMNIYAQCTR